MAKTILIVEDNDLNMKLINDLLQAHGYETMQTMDGRDVLQLARENRPDLIIVAPLSGHYATLLRGTVEAFLPTHNVYITDWTDARMAPIWFGRFDLDDYVDYVVAVQIPGVSEERLFAFIVVALTELELRFEVALRV